MKSVRPDPRVYLALGCNLGDRTASLARAVRSLAPAVSLDTNSRIYQSDPAYVTDQPTFYNAVVGGVTSLEPLALLRQLKRLESELGRVPSERNGPRAIDLDILFYGGDSFDSKELTIPHPRITERTFVLVPLVEIAPDLVHPTTGKTMRELLAAGTAHYGGDVRPVEGATLAP
jgi:2-amino-4-hydroxy-6-hydroxymethyldihydropteridine diphosphokinase